MYRHNKIEKDGYHKKFLKYARLILKKLAHDNKILENKLFTNDFNILNKKYYLANAKYHNINYFYALIIVFIIIFKNKPTQKKNW